MYILALDQGTTSSRAIVFDSSGNIVSVAQKEFPQIFPKPGWVEHNPWDIWNSQKEVMLEAVYKSGISPREITAIGVTNQRETTIVWDKETGEPIYNAIVWQCRRTANYCEELKNEGLSELIKEKTGLVIDAYFSGPKIKWILDNVPNARRKAEEGKLLFGTVDTWLIWNLTGGKVHVTDYSNASRTMLFNIKTLDWDDELLEIMNIPRVMMPKVLPSSYIYGTCNILDNFEIPISGDAGDQQAALFGQCGFEEGIVKNTYGTGCFILLNTGKNIKYSSQGLITTIAYGLGDEIYYALEGSVFIAGAVIQWLRDNLGIIKNSSESEILAKSVDDNGGVFFVPAFVGLGAPHWDMFARGLIIGITRGTKKEHIVRAALEAIAYQTQDVLELMSDETGIKIRELRVDGGASANNFLMQFQSDISNIRVIKPLVTETTSLGAAFLAGLGVGLWKSTDELKHLWREEKVFEPCLSEEKRRELLKKWKEAVRRAKNWE
uniref:Glycerol kinase n=1 Tax=Dictyoglomus turgidum TaxID=513050 RepID=A0A7C3SN34_9BACT